MNGANGVSDIEGKVAQGSDERVGRRVSFKHGCRRVQVFGDSGLQNPCQSVFIRGFAGPVK
jgi:hypothetical protein